MSDPHQRVFLCFYDGIYYETYILAWPFQIGLFFTLFYEAFRI